MLCCVFSLKHCKTFWHRSFIFSLIVSLGLVHQGTILLLALSRRVFLWFLHILFVPLYAATRELVTELMKLSRNKLEYYLRGQRAMEHILSAF